MNVCLHVCMSTTCVVPAEVRNSCQFPDTRVTDGHQPPCEGWESDPGPHESNKYSSPVSQAAFLKKYISFV